ncbi:MAG: GTPase Era [Candidatus Ratteibacteria bacterium]|nr:GTPase Era [Candidatus Ratteibacteria bacterium]
MKSGSISIVGKPNTGKSTLINALLERKVSIVSPRPAITRIRVLGIYNSEEGQIVILDTPGFENVRNELGRMMQKTIIHSIEEADIIIPVIDARGWQTEDERMLETIKKFNKSAILVINKIDLLPNKESLLPLIKESNERYKFLDIVPVSALKNKNINVLRKCIFSHLPEGDKLFPEDMITNLPLQYTIAEIIREKAVNRTYQEVPQSIAVEVEEIKPGDKNKDMMVVKANIIVDRENLKHIIIGKDGSKLKEIGQLARKEIEIILGKKTYLELWVKVIKDWRERPDIFRKFGYGDI